MAARGSQREPHRTCVGCRRVRPQTELVRLVARQGAVRLDEGKRSPGRGAYVCPEADCAARATGRLGKALRTNATKVEELIGTA